MNRTPLLAATSLLLTACVSSPDATYRLDDAARCPLSLHSGQTLVLALPSNPTTGLRWQLRDAAPDVLEQRGSEVYRQPDASQGVVGSDGRTEWRFDVTQPGQGLLQLDYRRPWEPAEQPAERSFLCAILVED